VLHFYSFFAALFVPAFLANLAILRRFTGKRVINPSPPHPQKTEHRNQNTKKLTGRNGRR